MYQIFRDMINDMIMSCTNTNIFCILCSSFLTLTNDGEISNLKRLVHIHLGQHLSDTCQASVSRSTKWSATTFSRVTAYGWQICTPTTTILGKCSSITSTSHRTPIPGRNGPELCTPMRSNSRSASLFTIRLPATPRMKELWAAKWFNIGAALRRTGRCNRLWFGERLSSLPILPHQSVSLHAVSRS